MYLPFLTTAFSLIRNLCLEVTFLSDLFLLPTCDSITYHSLSPRHNQHLHEAKPHPHACHFPRSQSRSCNPVQRNNNELLIMGCPECGGGELCRHVSYSRTSPDIIFHQNEVFYRCADYRTVPIFTA
jgi:hypothetical protein